MHMTVIPSADAVLSADAAGVAQWLQTYFQTMNAPAPHLSEAMSYAALNGGKRAVSYTHLTLPTSDLV